MSSRSTILLTDDNEHWFEDASEPLTDKEGKRQNAITLDFDKRNIRIDINDDESLVITLINPDSEIFKLIQNIPKQK